MQMPVATAELNGFGFILICLLTLCAFLPFIDYDYAVSYQYDTPIFMTHVSEYYWAIKRDGWSRLPRLENWPPYFDAYNVLLTGLTLATEVAAKYFSPISALLPTVETKINFWIRWLSLGFFSVGTGFLWLALQQIGSRPILNLVLAFIVPFTPVVMAMDMGRNDFGVLGALCAALYFLLSITKSEKIDFRLIGLGVSVAILATLKLNGPAFGLFVLAALGVLWKRGLLNSRHISLLLVPCVLFGLLLSVRQLYYIADIIPNLRSQLAYLEMWAKGYPMDELFYYSWNILEEKGTVFRVLVWITLPIVLAWAAITRRADVVAFLAIFLPFLIWSLLIDYAFARGGYHLLPMFVLLIAFAFSAICALRLPKSAFALLTTLVLAEPAWSAGVSYFSSASAMWERAYSVRITRELPATWMQRTFKKGTRVTTLLSDLLQFRPPYDLNHFVPDDTFQIKTGDTSGLSEFRPKTVNEIRKTGDLFIITDWHRNFLPWRLNTLGLNELTKEWTNFLAELDRTVPSVRFESNKLGYVYKVVDIYILNPKMSSEDIQRSLAAVDGPVTVRIPSAARRQ